MAGKEMGFMYCGEAFSEDTEFRVTFNNNFGISNCKLHVGRLIRGKMLPVFGKSRNVRIA